MAEQKRDLPRSPEAQAKRNLKTLERRLNHLKKRLDSLPNQQRWDGRVLSYDRSEILALQWAISQLGRVWNYAPNRTSA